MLISKHWNLQDVEKKRGKETHPAPVQLHFEWLWLGRWRRLDLEPVLAVLHSLFALLEKTIEGQHLQKVDGERERKRHWRESHSTWSNRNSLELSSRLIVFKYSRGTNKERHSTSHWPYTGAPPVVRAPIIHSRKGRWTAPPQGRRQTKGSF